MPRVELRLVSSGSRQDAVDDVLPLIKKLCNLRATWEEATAGLEKQAAASD